ncbi:hypothetical protein BDF22DRAFT_693758 [Syncephalis plumigaleata]|nr:hypothetical protein BDF22DRAFT_693758 [Syncephalis plumigaleata]
MSAYHSLIDSTAAAATAAISSTSIQRMSPVKRYSDQKSYLPPIPCHSRKSSSESTAISDEFNYSPSSPDRIDDNYVDPYLFGSDDDTAVDDDDTCYSDVKRAIMLPLQRLTPVTGPEALSRSPTSMPNILETDNDDEMMSSPKHTAIQHNRTKSVTADEWARSILNSTDPNLCGKQQRWQSQASSSSSSPPQSILAMTNPDMPQSYSADTLPSFATMSTDDMPSMRDDNGMDQANLPVSRQSTDLLVSKLAELRSASDTDLYNAIENLHSIRRTKSQRYQGTQPATTNGLQPQRNTFPIGRYSQYNLPPQIAYEIHQLELQNAYLAHQNRIVTRELSQAKCSSQALRTVCLQKERAISRLQDDLMSALERTRVLEKNVADLKMDMENRRLAEIAQSQRKFKRSSMSSLGLDNITGGWFRNRRRSIDEDGFALQRDLYTRSSMDLDSARSSDEITRDTTSRYGRYSLDSISDGKESRNGCYNDRYRTGMSSYSSTSSSSSSTSSSFSSTSVAASAGSSLGTTVEDPASLSNRNRRMPVHHVARKPSVHPSPEPTRPASSSYGFRKRVKAIFRTSSNLNSPKAMFSAFRSSSSSDILQRRTRNDSYESFFSDFQERESRQRYGNQLRAPV